MVALAPQPLPTLPPDEAARFAALIRLHLNLEALADQLATPIHTLIAWASTPRIQAWIDAYRTLHNACLELQRIHFQTHAMTALSTALDHLTNTQPTNPVEIRRAASALVSATNASLRAARTPSPPAPTPGGSTHPSALTPRQTLTPTSSTQDSGPRTPAARTPTPRPEDRGQRTLSPDPQQSTSHNQAPTTPATPTPLSPTQHSAPSTQHSQTPTSRTKDRGLRTSLPPPDPLSRPHRPRPTTTLLARAGVPP